MALPFVLSPYLRPLRQGDAPVQSTAPAAHEAHSAAVALIDNGVTGRVERLDPLCAQVLRALWREDEAEAALRALGQVHGLPAIEAALADLWDRAMLFESRAACDALYDQVLAAGLQPVPFIDQVELTNRCPMRCGFCPRGVPGRMQRPLGFMDLGLFERLLDQLHPAQARYRPLELHHLGESLLHPQVDRFAALASARGLPTELSVNPSLLTPELGRRLLRAGVRRLVLSLDGMDDATLVAIRGPAARYGAAERNIAALLSEVAGMADPPRVVIQMIDLAQNQHQREALLTRWGATGLPTVFAYVKDLDGPDPLLGRPTATPVVHLCSYPFRSVVVLWDGRVVPCCRDDDGRLILGDLNQQPLAAIWQGEAAQALRAQHQRGDLPEGHLCHGCAWRRERFAAAMPARHPDRAVADPLRW